MDYIDGLSFKAMCDIGINDHIPHTTQAIILYADTHDYEKAIEKINSHKHIKFVLVTHNSDHSIQATNIPENLIHWFGANVEFEHEKITPIPIGLENEHWHPQKRPILAQYYNIKTDRKIKAFAQFNPATFPQERRQILRNIRSGLIHADSFYCINGQEFTSYANNLTKYAFCLCPRGNGIDTHRIWEALYMGCIPIIKQYATHNFQEDLPIIFVKYWLEITQDFLEQKIKDIDYSLFNSKLLTMSYWKERIINEKNKYQLL